MKKYKQLTNEITISDLWAERSRLNHTALDEKMGVTRDEFSGVPLK
ncbi:hypothetical protein LFE_0637 [Leptospirillum ferrooxidans C2-3]|uniref:Uncharacterized protein n=1 Tax=Leptospirillum ferrooxidans (strain C2-3) TaxID=1162668 RepID=I0IM54_LEPFC|nr:hypothetical protein LFE_0637 [Leptospirillum ferrooxidans C2-3]